MINHAGFQSVAIARSQIGPRSDDFSSDCTPLLAVPQRLEGPAGPMRARRGATDPLSHRPGRECAQSPRHWRERANGSSRTGEYDRRNRPYGQPSYEGQSWPRSRPNADQRPQTAAASPLAPACSRTDTLGPRRGMGRDSPPCGSQPTLRPPPPQRCSRQAGRAGWASVIHLSLLGFDGYASSLEPSKVGIPDGGKFGFDAQPAGSSPRPSVVKVVDDIIMGVLPCPAGEMRILGA